VLDTIQANWPAVALAIVIGLLVAWWLFSRSGRPRERYRAPDALDEGAAPAQRNQALIDAPSATSIRSAGFADTGPDIFGGIGELVAAAAAREVKAAEPQPAPAGTDATDDLTRIKGLGPKLATLLGGLGVSRFDQIAAWNDADIDRIDAQLGSFAGRIRRDNWVEQAKFLAAGDTAGFEDKFGKL